MDIIRSKIKIQIKMMMGNSTSFLSFNFFNIKLLALALSHIVTQAGFQMLNSPIPPDMALQSSTP